MQNKNAIDTANNKRYRKNIQQQEKINRNRNRMSRIRNMQLWKIRQKTIWHKKCRRTNMQHKVWKRWPNKGLDIKQPEHPHIWKKQNIQLYSLHEQICKRNVKTEYGPIQRNREGRKRTNKIKKKENMLHMQYARVEGVSLLVRFPSRNENSFPSRGQEILFEAFRLFL